MQPREENSLLYIVVICNCVLAFVIMFSKLDVLWSCLLSLVTCGGFAKGTTNGSWLPAERSRAVCIAKVAHSWYTYIGCPLRSKFGLIFSITIRF